VVVSNNRPAFGDTSRHLRGYTYNMATNVPVTGETPIAIKISVNDSLKKLKLPLKDLTADALFVKVR